MKRTWILAGLAAFLAACTATPDEPAFDNPFDPEGTRPGTAYELVVVAVGDSLTMSWNNLDGVSTYSVFWSDSGPDFASMEPIEDGQGLRPPTGGLRPLRMSFSHRTFTPEQTNWYRVRAQSTESTGAGIRENAVPSEVSVVDIDVMVVPTGLPTLTPTRQIQIDLLTGMADTVEVSNERDFTGSASFAVVPGVRETVPWTLPAVAENRTDLWVHFRSRAGGSIAPQDSFPIEARFTPSLSIVRGARVSPGGAFMVDTLQIYAIDPVPGQSLVSVERFSVTAEDTMLIGDLTPPSLADPVTLRWDPAVDEAVDNRVIATLGSDFGFTETALLILRHPTGIGDPTVEVVDGPTVTTRDIEVECVADQAGYVLISESPDFAGGTAVPWAAVVDYQLENVLGTRFLYAAYSNPLLGETRVASTLVTLVSLPAPHGR